MDESELNKLLDQFGSQKEEFSALIRKMLDMPSDPVKREDEESPQRELNVPS